MTNWASWFRQQLQSSADGFVWAFEQIAPDLHDPLLRMGLWWEEFQQEYERRVAAGE